MLVPSGRTQLCGVYLLLLYEAGTNVGDLRRQNEIIFRDPRLLNMCGLRQARSRPGPGIEYWRHYQLSCEATRL